MNEGIILLSISPCPEIQERAKSQYISTLIPCSQENSNKSEAKVDVLKRWSTPWMDGQGGSGRRRRTTQKTRYTECKRSAILSKQDFLPLGVQSRK